MHPARVLRGPATLHRILPLRLGIQRLDHLGVLDVVSSARELHHLGQGKPPASRERVHVLRARSAHSGRRHPQDPAARLNR